jgi:hypothetical protein
MTEYKKGQRVRVEYEGTIETVLKGSDGPQTALYVHVYGAHKDKSNYVYPKHAKVTLLDPPDWPPQVGDIWEAEGREWFCAYSPKYGEDRMVPENSGTRTLPLGSFKALNPVLVRRRGQ